MPCKLEHAYSPIAQLQIMCESPLHQVQSANEIIRRAAANGISSAIAAYAFSATAAGTKEDDVQTLLDAACDAVRTGSYDAVLQALGHHDGSQKKAARYAIALCNNDLRSAFKFRALKACGIEDSGAGISSQEQQHTIAKALPRVYDMPGMKDIAIHAYRRACLCAAALLLPAFLDKFPKPQQDDFEKKAKSSMLFVHDMLRGFQPHAPTLTLTDGNEDPLKYVLNPSTNGAMCSQLRRHATNSTELLLQVLDGIADGTSKMPFWNAPHLKKPDSVTASAPAKSSYCISDSDSDSGSESPSAAASSGAGRSKTSKGAAPLSSRHSAGASGKSRTRIGTGKKRAASHPPVLESDDDARPDKKSRST